MEQKIRFNLNGKDRITLIESDTALGVEISWDYRNQVRLRNKDSAVHAVLINRRLPGRACCL
jgi:hypothetical protein